MTAPRREGRQRRGSFLRMGVALAILALSLTADSWAQAAGTRVYDGWKHGFVAWSVMLEHLAKENAVLVGEAHDSPATHACENALLNDLAQRCPHVVLALEMFERDVQVTLDRWLNGEIDDAALMADARPWPSFTSDYKPLLDTARARKLPVLASNVPRPLAAAVALEGVGALDALPADHRWLFARHTTIADGPYRKRFDDTMHAHAGADRLDRYFAAQCLKDDTMAESIADALERRRPNPPLVLHISGGFHIDGNLGLYTCLRERLPKERIATVRIVAVEDLGSADVPRWEHEADWVIFVKAP